VASVGTYSGPIGNAQAPVVQGAQVWVKHVNGKGGVGGHRVELVVYDDGGDPARHRAQVQDAIERRGVIAFLQNSEPISGAGSVEYINQRRVPVIGMSGAEGWAASSPMYFPQASTGQSLYDAVVAGVAAEWVPQGYTKVGTLVCTEGQACPDTEKTFARDAAKFGYEHVYRGKTSLAQPDYTAECLAARSAGAEALFMILDANGISRVASACARQGYRPRFSAVSAATAVRFKDDPNLDGFIGPSPVFPYFQSGTLATDEFRAAMRANNVPLSPSGAHGWTAGKLLEKAAAGLSEPQTSEGLLLGLWSIKNDTLGGLTGPLTFIKDQPALNPACWYLTGVKNGEWVSPNGFQLNCR
jgi:branched-chain amino acid transport system substrate-binding protein